MKKIIAMVFALVLVMALCTGCTKEDMNITVDADGNGIVKTSILIDKQACVDFMKDLEISEDEINEMLNQGFDMASDVLSEKNIDGKDYYYVEEEDTFTGHSELQAFLEESFEDVYVLRNTNGIRFVYDASAVPEEIFEDEDFAEYRELLKKITISFAVKMPEKILKCSPNGVISEDGYTAAFALTGEEILKSQEFMVSTAAESTAPRITGIKDGEVVKDTTEVCTKDESGIASFNYTVDGETQKVEGFLTEIKKNGEYIVSAEDYYGNKASKTFTLKDEEGPEIGGVKNRTINKPYRDMEYVYITDNTEVKSVKLTKDGKTKSKKIEDGECEFTVSSTGKYTVKATDINGNTSSVSFVMDKIKPAVTGVKNGSRYTKAVTVKYSDNYKVKSATINGESFKSGKKISRNGKYKVVVKDTAGNTRTVKFTIAK